MQVIGNMFYNSDKMEVANVISFDSLIKLIFSIYIAFHERRLLWRHKMYMLRSYKGYENVTDFY